MKKMRRILYFLPLFLLFSCTEDIVIDLEKGDSMIGVDACFTDQCKRHEVVLSYSADFYHSHDIRMVSGARVRIVGGGDTIVFAESDSLKGHYFSDSVAGKKCTLYRLEMEVPMADGSGRYEQLYAESYMGDNVDRIDSVVLRLSDDPVMRMLGDIYSFYPYFQTLPNPQINYLIHVFQNDSQLTNLHNTFPISTAGYAGFYCNGPEMRANNMLIAVFNLKKENLHDSDLFRIEFQSVPLDYMLFAYSLLSSSGSNPMMGSPANVPTNVFPKGRGVGFFHAASVVSCEVRYLP